MGSVLAEGERPKREVHEPQDEWQHWAQLGTAQGRAAVGQVNVGDATPGQSLLAQTPSPGFPPAFSFTHSASKKVTYLLFFSPPQ